MEIIQVMLLELVVLAEVVDEMEVGHILPVLQELQDKEMLVEILEQQITAGPVAVAVQEVLVEMVLDRMV